MKLFSFWQSSASYRVRIALNLKGLDAHYVSINLSPDVQAQLKPDYLDLNPEGRIPAIAVDEGLIGQSMAIMEWLEELHPEPALLPGDPWQRAKCRQFANTIACDIHPLNNASVLRWLTGELEVEQAKLMKWYKHWINRGFEPLEKQAAASEAEFLFGDAPGMAEICLIPQMFKGRQFGMKFETFPTLCALEEKCLTLDAFERARPENQPDAPENL
ncbi:maleylacetoacetate isomerase [Ponticaulis sp.]|uniref:maleylacetoacetate isomerase n=1 Tax=Ponticaulis sp. TaxID=2020902 RepID=UPI000B6C7FEC|nr:maleylacetoacetate isomerase [Ponticaulis sp.]MAI91502.1 maleylacetoacetate isomerase [Ponticaulis sp.]OUX97465.1 MAG: maleylacetoacetate isomerase [Hyphomonadaceae bacterium TMED5]|tara:strand:+ start:11471 stop:12118 length:648 start_codon:yes stop_codon:yes gene_type:complete